MKTRIRNSLGRLLYKNHIRCVKNSNTLPKVVEKYRGCKYPIVRNSPLYNFLYRFMKRVRNRQKLYNKLKKLGRRL